MRESERISIARTWDQQIANTGQAKTLGKASVHPEMREDASEFQYRYSSFGIDLAGCFRVKLGLKTIFGPCRELQCASHCLSRSE